jgi:antibiotic biosynthesis monooxygenase (ABM) superfamily enzyme
MPSFDRSPKQVVLWVIWFSMVVSTVIYQVELGGGILSGKNAVQQGLQFPMPIVFTQLCIATVIRWIFVPRATESRKLLVLLIPLYAKPNGASILEGGRQS